MARTRVRRRRLVVIAAALGVIGVLSGSVANAVGASAAEPSRTYVIRPGDTLWSIAGRSSPAIDPRLVIDAIREANDLDPAALVPGQRLLIPSLG